MSGRIRDASNAVLASVLVGLVVAGCESAPKGNSGGRLDVSETTPGETADGKVNVSSLLELTDRAADAIVEELPRLRVSQPGNTSKFVIYLGDFENNTGTSSRDFDLAMRRPKSRLVNERRIRNSFEIRSEVASMDRLRQRFQRAAPPADDPLQEGKPRPAAGATDTVDARYVYLLMGEFNDAVRNGKTQFFLNFKLVHLDTGEEEVSASKDLTQQN